MVGSTGREDGGSVSETGPSEPSGDRTERGGVDERPGRERHEVPGRIPGGSYHEYRYVREVEDGPVAEEGGVGWLASDEWLAYDVEVARAGEYEVSARVAAEADYGGGTFGVVVDRTPLKAVTFDATGGWYDWETAGTTVELPAGLHTLRLVVLTGGWNLESLTVE